MPNDHISQPNTPRPMSQYLIAHFRPEEMDDTELELLAKLVFEPFTWYNPGASIEYICRFLHGGGNTDVDVIINPSGEGVGFLVTRPYRVGASLVCFHVGVSILSHARGEGLYAKLTGRALKRNTYHYLAARTQNPQVYDTLSRFANYGVYPAVDGSNPGLLVRAVALAASEGHPGFDAETLIVRGAYAHVRQDRSHLVTRHRATQKLFSTQLGPTDGFMVVAAL